MGQEAANVEQLREAYRNWHESKGGSADHWMSICDERIDFRSLADGVEKLEFTQRYKSREDLAEYFNGLTGSFDMIHFTVDEFVAQDDRVAAPGRRPDRNNTVKEFETPKVDVWRFKDGRAIEFFEYYDTAIVQAALAE